MRYALIPILVVALGARVAFALPSARPDGVAASKTDVVRLVAKKKPAPMHATRRKAKNTGGIHPLVGSGDY